jgi:hypothetical protein
MPVNCLVACHVEECFNSHLLLHVSRCSSSAAALVFEELAIECV